MHVTQSSTCIPALSMQGASKKRGAAVVQAQGGTHTASPSSRRLKLSLCDMERGWNLSAEEALRHFGVSPSQGLSAERAKAELAKYGPNGMYWLQGIAWNGDR